jgi:hypothetical protein
MKTVTTDNPVPYTSTGDYGILAHVANLLQFSFVAGLIKYARDKHHSQADTLDKVDLEDFRKNTAALAVIAYIPADSPGRLILRSDLSPTSTVRPNFPVFVLYTNHVWQGGFRALHNALRFLRNRKALLKYSYAVWYAA